MATFYVSRFRLIDSGTILQTFEDGDITTVDFTIGGNVASVEGMSFDTRNRTGYVLPNISPSFTFSSLIRTQQEFIDLLGTWDYINDISVTFEAAFPQSFQTLGDTKYITFNGVMPSEQSLSATSAGTDSTTQYQFLAIGYTSG